jgi:UDP-galactopyranose mutase
VAEKPNVVIIGAGPAGLTAGWELVKRDVPVTILEGDSIAGGISRTAEREGWRFDIGGHRFFTKVPEVEKLWHEILPDEDFLLRPRSSRIFYNGKLYDYPLKAGNALRNLGYVEAAKCIASYAAARIRPPKDQSDYESWLVARFGWRLYRTFFKTYTEKVWGVPVSEMPSDWAAQRVKSLSLSNAIINAVLPKRNQKEITSLIEEFQYPKYGPGMMWETAATKIDGKGGRIIFEEKVSKIHHSGGRATGLTTTVTGGYGPGAGAPEASRTDIGAETHYDADEIISSMSFSSLLKAMDPAPPAHVLAAADALRYRDFLTVALVVPESAGFPDNWIYIHSRDVKVGRIQNFASWSPFLVKDGRNVLGLEYTVFENDAEWTAPDEDLIEKGKQELDKLGLVGYKDIEAGYVVRQPKAYPIYDDRYQANVDVIRGWLTDYASNVHPVGRNGMFRYNNADHSMYTAMLTAENIVKGTTHDVWSVNVEEEYHEQKDGGSPGSAKAAGSLGTGRDAPVLPRKVLDAARSRVAGSR